MTSCVYELLRAHLDKTLHAEPKRRKCNGRAVPATWARKADINEIGKPNPEHEIDENMAVNVRFVGHSGERVDERRTTGSTRDRSL